MIPAICAGNIKRVHQLLDENPRWVDEVDFWGVSALGVAISYGRKLIAQDLITRGADVNASNIHTNLYPLWYAVDRNDVEMVRLLLVCGANCTDTVLHYAASNGYINVVAVLHEYAPLSYPFIITGAIRYNHKNVIKFLCERAVSVSSEEVMFLAARRCTPDIILLLFDCGAAISIKCFRETLTYDNVDALKTFFKLGGNPFCVPGILETAMQLRAKRCFRWIYKNAPETYSKIFGDTLLISIRQGWFSFTKWLVHNGASVNAPECLSMAIKRRSLKTVDLLWKNGADMKFCDRFAVSNDWETKYIRELWKRGASNTVVKVYSLRLLTINVIYLHRVEWREILPPSLFEFDD